MPATAELTAAGLEPWPHFRAVITEVEAEAKP